MNENLGVDILDINEKHLISIRLHRTVFSHAAVSTIFAQDTGRYETCYINDQDENFCLQQYDDPGSARDGHIFWARKVREGFVATGQLEENFTLEACLKFLSLLQENLPKFDDLKK